MSGATRVAPISRPASVRRLMAIGVTLIVLLSPFLWLLQMSFKTNDLILQFPPPLFFTPTLENYARALAERFSGVLRQQPDQRLVLHAAGAVARRAGGLRTVAHGPVAARMR